MTCCQSAPEPGCPCGRTSRRERTLKGKPSAAASGTVPPPAAKLLLRPGRRALRISHSLASVPASRVRTSPTARSRRVGSGSGRCAWIW